MALITKEFAQPSSAEPISADTDSEDWGTSDGFIS